MIHTEMHPIKDEFIENVIECLHWGATEIKKNYFAFALI